MANYTEEEKSAIAKFDKIQAIAENMTAPTSKEEIIYDDFGKEVNSAFNNLMPFDGIDSTFSDIELGKGDYGSAMSAILADSLLSESNNPIDYEAVAVGVEYIGEELKSLQGKKGDDLMLDDLNGLNGSELIPLGLLISFYAYANAPIPELTGTLTPNKHSNLWKLYRIKPVVQRGTGSMNTGDPINAITMGNALAHKARYKRFIFKDTDIIGGEASYTFTVFQKEDDTVGSEIPVAKTSIVFLGKDNAELDDYSVNKGSTSCSPSTEINGVEVKMKIIYLEGKITVTIPVGALNDGDSFIINSQSDIKKLSETRGMVEVDITPATYPSTPISLGSSDFKFDADVVKTHLGFGLLPLNMKNVIDKQIAEIQKIVLEKANMCRRLWREPLNLRANANVANKDIFMHLSAELLSISTSMTTKSGISRGIFMIGGSGLQKALTLSGGTVRNNTAYAGVRPIGKFDNAYNCYFDPRYDLDNPMVDADGNVNVDEALNAYHQISVFGIAPTAGQRLILVGFPRPLRTEGIPVNEDSIEMKFVEGEFMAEINKDPATHMMAVTLLVKGL